MSPAKNESRDRLRFRNSIGLGGGENSKDLQMLGSKAAPSGKLNCTVMKPTASVEKDEN
jgi:hypothetical protein